VSEDLDLERERFGDLQRTYNAAVARFEEAQQRAVEEVTSTAEAGLRSSLRAVQDRMRSMATEQSTMQRTLSEKQERLELLSDSIIQLQSSLVDEEASNRRLQEEVAHLRQQLASAISMPAPRSIQYDGDDMQLQLRRLRQEKQELEERVRELQHLDGTKAQWEEQLRQLEGMQYETQQETERMLSQVGVPQRASLPTAFVTRVVQASEHILYLQRQLAQSQQSRAPALVSSS
jgi:predicted nuclease with TOPRIM domain